MQAFEKAARRAQSLSKKRDGIWYVVLEAGEYHVLSEVEAFDQWCIKDDQIRAAFEAGEFLE